MGANQMSELLNEQNLSGLNDINPEFVIFDKDFSFLSLKLKPI